jgi:hypothetical protein
LTVALTRGELASMHPEPRRGLLSPVAIFAVAMGYVEAAVVVYLRRLYYPHGFSFPLAGIDSSIAGAEVVRELATIVMLGSVGVIAGRTRAQRFAYFVYAFGIWDIVYYLGLKATLGWPQSLLTWDILFLFPVPWVGPVLAPCLVAATMIAFGVLIVRAVERGSEERVTRRELAMLAAGTMIMLACFMTDWLRNEGVTLVQNLASHRDPLTGLDSYVPHEFPWLAFLVGEAAVVIAVVSFGIRHGARQRSEHIASVWLRQPESSSRVAEVASREKR